MDAAASDRIEAELLSAGDATLPDGIVEGTSLSDWQAVLEMIGRRQWACEFTLDGERQPLPETAARLFEAQCAGLVAIHIAPAIRINVFPNAVTEILFDFSTKEVQGGGMAVVGAFVRELGLAVGKRVVLSHEGDLSMVFLTYDPVVDSFEPAD